MSHDLSATSLKDAIAALTTNMAKHAPPEVIASFSLPDTHENMVTLSSLLAKGPYTRVFDTNVKGVFFAMKAQVEAMRRMGGGSIINLSSTGGSRGMAGMSVYVASKHAVEGLSKAAALDLASDNIRVNVVAPGPTLTAMLDRVTDGHPERLAQRVPLGRAGSPEELARAIAWIASDEASFVNGVVLPVNGGISAA
jgi:NAD(P)-dependent dehydrogenase (short-subunit alcohol dehydrogenase family)